LQKLLSKALTKIEQLNDELRIDKDHSKTTKDDLSSVQSKLGRTEREKRFLIECVRDMEDDFVAKDERIEKLQNVVETQLDTVEYLEEQLDRTEEEVLLMEDELNALIFAVEKKKEVTEEKVSELVSNNEGSHASNKQGRFARVGSIREDMVSRKNSIKMQKAESRRLLFNESVKTESSRRNCPSSTHSSSRSHDVDERENKLQLRELKLEADREECNLREERLDRLERDLLDTDNNNNNNNNKVTNERGTSQAEHSERNDVVSELTVAPCNLEPENEEVSQLIASLQKEKENLHAIQIEDSEKLKKLKAENEDLRVKFDHFRGTTSLQENLRSQNDGCDEEGKDLLIRELQNQLVASKLEAHQFSSGSYVTKLKFEIKTLKQNIRDLKNNVKKEECILKSQLKKKDDSIKLIEKQMQKLKIEIERREKRDKNLGTDQILSDVALQHHIEDLEEEIFHWKSAHADLENEIETMKSRSDEMDGIYQDDVNADGVGDDCSIGSVQSLIPQIEMPLNMSQDDLFFVSNSDSMSSISGIPPLQNEEPATQSTRAMRTVSSLWSKMTTGVEPTNSNPAIPYATGMLNDE
jgi:DNA repair exonuclease SbcCD ATPase subunit